MYVIVKIYFIISLRFLYGYLICLLFGIVFVNDCFELKGNDVIWCSFYYRIIFRKYLFLV